MRLSKTAAIAIADLVNTLVVSRQILTEALAETPVDQKVTHAFRIAESRAFVELADQFGIECPAIDIHRARVARESLATA